MIKFQINSENLDKAEELVRETEIFKNCTNIVVGRGNLNSEIMFIGEAPGKNEDLQGMPFVGAAGKKLDSLLNRVGLGIDDIYIANILKCRPPGNRNPSKEEIIKHTPWLIRQIKEIRPKVICTLGNYATKFFLASGNAEEMAKQPGITNVHGMVKSIEFDGLRIKIIPLFHPAATIYNQSLIPKWEKDMEIIKGEIS